MIYRIAKWLLLFALSPLLLLLYLALWPVTIVLILRDRRWQREFRLRHDGHYFLACTSRREWYDFVKKNVETVLPSSITLCWAARKSRDGISIDVLRVTPFSARWHSRPYLIAVRQFGVETVALHEKLLPLKHHAKKSLETQAQVAEIIRVALKDLDIKQE